MSVEVFQNIQKRWQQQQKTPQQREHQGLLKDHDWHSGRRSAVFHLLTVAELPQAEIVNLLSVASDLSAHRIQNRSQSGRLRGLTLAALFEKPSTRTRAAFCTAAVEEGALPLCLGAGDIHLGEKESVEDTARVLSQYFALVAWRGHRHALLERLAESASVPVLNLLSDDHHPTQALADALTMIQEFGSLEQRKVVFFGDVTNNVARSLCEMGQKLGFGVVLCGPESLLESAQVPTGPGITREPDPIRAARDAHVLYTDVWTSMGDPRAASGAGHSKDSKKDDAEDMFLPYQVNPKIVSASGRKETIVLHCLPAYRGREVTSDVLDGSQSRVLLQAENRLHTIKAILLRALDGV